MDKKSKEELDSLLSDVSGKKFNELTPEEMEEISGAVKDIDPEATPITAVSLAACLGFLTGVISWTIKGK